jgi:hypothetical protein
MPIPQHLKRRLQQSLGTEAAEDFVSWMEGVDNARADIAELRHEMQVGFARVDARFAGVDTKFAGIDTKFASLDGRFSALEALIEKRTADLIKWSFGFWIGAVVAIAILARVIR